MVYENTYVGPSSGPKLTVFVPKCGLGDSSGEAKSPVDVTMRGVRNSGRVRCVTRITIEGTNRCSIMLMWFIFEIGQAERLRATPGHRWKCKILFGQWCHSGTVVGIRQMLLCINIRLQWYQWLTIIRQSTGGPRIGRPRKGIGWIVDAGVDWALIAGMKWRAGQWDACLVIT